MNQPRELTPFQARAAAQALTKLLYGRHFSISCLQDLAELLGRELGGTDYQALRGLHCVDWVDMPEPLRTQAREKIIELLGLPPLVITSEKAKPEAEPKPETEPARRLRLAFWRT